MKRKQCSKCCKTRLIKFFGKSTTKGHQNYCLDCQRAYYHKNVTRIKTQARASNIKRIAAHKQKLLELLKRSHCAECGENDHVVLEFDHVRGKKVNNISKMINRASGWMAICKEIEKCDIVCANCHRRRSYRRSGSYRLT